MKRMPLWASVLFAVSSVAFAAPSAPPVAHVEHAWIRWLPANLPAAGYAVIVNDSDTPVRLVSASSPDYRNVSLMQSRLADDDSTMVKVSGIDVPAHGTTKLSPGDFHIMLAHATHPIQPGDTVKMTLDFAGGGSLQTDFSVLPANASGPTD